MKDPLRADKREFYKVEMKVVLRECYLAAERAFEMALELVDLMVVEMVVEMAESSDF